MNGSTREHTETDNQTYRQTGANISNVNQGLYIQEYDEGSELIEFIVCGRQWQLVPGI